MGSYPVEEQDNLWCACCTTARELSGTEKAEPAIRAHALHKSHAGSFLSFLGKA